MSQTAKQAFEEIRKWIILLGVLFCAGLGSFLLYSARSEVKTIVREELKAYVSTAEFTAEKAAAKELQLSEARNVSDKLGRIETGVKELKDFVMPVKRRVVGFDPEATNVNMVATFK